jgi:hypothetical protein
MPHLLATRLMMVACLPLMTAQYALTQKAPEHFDPGVPAFQVLIVPTDVDANTKAFSELRSSSVGKHISAVYTSDEKESMDFALRVQDVVGGSLQPYDRRGMSPADFARVLANNCTTVNDATAVAVVIAPDLVLPFLQSLSSLGGPAPSNQNTHRARGEALVVSIGGDMPSIARLRLAP